MAANRIVPATGSYAARGAGDPAAYSVRATVKRKDGRTTVSITAGDRCGGFASFPRLKVTRTSGGMPVFSGRVGGARVAGRWVGETRIDGTVKTPCAKAQEYQLLLAT